MNKKIQLQYLNILAYFNGFEDNILSKKSVFSPFANECKSNFLQTSTYNRNCQAYCLDNCCCLSSTLGFFTVGFEWRVCLMSITSASLHIFSYSIILKLHCFASTWGSSRASCQYNSNAAAVFSRCKVVLLTCLHIQHTQINISIHLELCFWLTDEC